MMFKKKQKQYLVTLISKTRQEVVETKAFNKKEAEEIVMNVITQCSLFNYLGKIIEVKARRKR